MSCRRPISVCVRSGAAASGADTPPRSEFTWCVSAGIRTLPVCRWWIRTLPVCCWWVKLCLCWPGAPQHHQNPVATQRLFKQLAARSKQSHACGGSGEPAVCPRTRCFARACEHLMRQVEYLPHDRDVALGDRVGRPPPALISDNRLRSRARMRTWTQSTSNTVVPRLPLGRQHSPVSAHGVLRRPLMRARSFGLGGRPRAQRPQAPIGLVRHQ